MAREVRVGGEQGEIGKERQLRVRYYGQEEV